MIQLTFNGISGFHRFFFHTTEKNMFVIAPLPIYLLVPSRPPGKNADTVPGQRPFYNSKSCRLQAQVCSVCSSIRPRVCRTDVDSASRGFVDGFRKRLRTVQPDDTTRAAHTTPLDRAPILTSDDGGTSARESLAVAASNHRRARVKCDAIDPRRRRTSFAHAPLPPSPRHAYPRETSRSASRVLKFQDTRRGTSRLDGPRGAARVDCVPNATSLFNMMDARVSLLSVLGGGTRASSKEPATATFVERNFVRCLFIYFYLYRTSGPE